MSPIKPEYRAHQQKRWMRHDAWRFIRPDWRRFVKAGSEAAAHFERYERKYRPDQLRDDHGRWADEGGGAGGGPSTPNASGEPTAGSGRSDPRVLSDATPDNYYKPGTQLAGDITGFTRHGINQAISRGISPSAILDAVARPLQILPQANGTTRYVGAGAVVVLNPAGSVVTVWGR